MIAVPWHVHWSAIFHSNSIFNLLLDWLKRELKVNKAFLEENSIYKDNNKQ